MPIIYNALVYSNDLGNGLTEVEYEFRDHLYPSSPAINLQKQVPTGTDTDADMQAMIPELNAQLEEVEISTALGQTEIREYPYPPDFQHQTKVEFIRRYFGGMMQNPNILQFNNALPFFQAFEIDADSGNNAPQRAAYLGIDTATYQLIEKRFNDMIGVQTLINDEKGRVWGEYPDGYW